MEYAFELTSADELPGRDFRAEDFAGLTADQIADIALWLQEGSKENDRLARTDGLTGVHNALAWKEDLYKLLERPTSERRQGLPDTPAFCFIDIDNFGTINGTHDEHHDAGDKALKKLAQTIVVSCRQFDKVYRTGGDEFVVWFHYLDPTQLDDVATRLQVIVDDCLSQWGTGASVGSGFSRAEANRQMYSNKFRRKNIQR